MKISFVLKKETKEKLIRMCLLLFPKFKVVRVSRSGSVIFKTKKWSLRSYRIPWSEMLMHQLPKALSLARWNNLEVTEEFASEITKIFQMYQASSLDNRFERIILYIWSEFGKTKIRNVFENANEVIIPLENGFLKYLKDTPRINPLEKQVMTRETIIPNLYSRLGDFSNTISSSKLLVASMVLLAFLNLKVWMNAINMPAISVTAVKINGIFPWIIANTS